MAEKVPLLVPPDREKATVRPPVVRELLFASLADRVTVTVEPEATVEREAVTRD